MKRLWLLLILMLASATVVVWYYGGDYLQQQREAGADETSLSGDNGGGSGNPAATDAADSAAGLLPPVPVTGSWPLPLDTRFQPRQLGADPASPPAAAARLDQSADGDVDLNPDVDSSPFVPPLFAPPGAQAMLDELIDAPWPTVVAAAGDNYFRKNLAQRWPEVLPEAVIVMQSETPAGPGEVVVRLNPPVPGARVWLGDSGDLSTNSQGLVRIRDVPTGPRELTVQAPRYEPVIVQLDVEAEGTDYVVNLQALAGGLEVVTTPGAELMAIDQDGTVFDLGTADAEGWLRSYDTLQIGEYTLQLVKPNWDPAEEQVELRVARIIRWQQPLMPHPGQLRVVSVPTDARVDLLLPGQDVRSVGETPLSIDDVPAGEDVDVAVVMRGYRREVRRVRLDAAETRIVNFGTLVAGAGDLELVVENDGFDAERAVVVVDDSTAWPRPAGDPLLLEGLEAGERGFEIRHPEFQTYSGTVAVIDNDHVLHSVYLTPLPAEITLAVTGPGADSWSADVNGVPPPPVLAPRSPLDAVSGRRTFAVPSDEDLTVTVSAPGWYQRQQTVRLNRGEQRFLEFELEREARPEDEDFSVVELPVGETMEFVRIEPGEFIMGSDDGEQGRFPDEGPETRVRITRPFWLGKTPVTQAQWQAVMDSSLAALRDRDDPNWPLHGVAATHPVYYVSWDEAMAFCRRLTERERSAGRLPEGYYFTLPSEAQWEYAARAGSESRWSFGDDESELDLFSWNSNNSGGRTHPVGQKLPNAWGLYDIHGNVWEWTRSWYGPYPGGTVVDYEGAPSGTTRVHRSSSWNASTAKTRSAYRDWLEPSKRGYDLGFRVAIEQQSTAEWNRRNLPAEDIFPLR